MKYCRCKEYKKFINMFGNIKVLIHGENTGTYGLAKDVWGFKYCPFCSKKIGVNYEKNNSR